MKKNIAPLLFGIVFILAGIGYVGAIFFNWDFSIFFDGWWTLFIIIPSFISMLSNGPRAFNVGAFIIGILLLLEAQDIIPNNKFGFIIFATIILYIGIVMIIRYFKGPKVSTNTYTYTATDGSSFQYTQTPNGQPEANPNKSWSYDNEPQPCYTAILSGVDAKNTSTDFLGAKVSAILGGVDLDLRDVVITRDIIIHVTAIMGGIDILAPRNVRIALNKTDIMGASECKAMSQAPDANVPLVTFICTTVMGGIDIK
ncbi:LiaF-related protein [Paludicola sp. MB14-C6]|uniref:LiaF transmembrane domain-containing protein n=1 Tax=Paludihabitans sp. MB14-C6 TaxID=3070656 RepID=UPI0027DB5F1D|nr:LiaF domain-containing protein [Paludicola sp. MB14-C6]WMJ22175.1 LiaF-related protein [Paludicola sp. MB14-C6]